MKNQMPCERCHELLFSYATGDIPPEDFEFIEKHLAHCSDCQQEAVLWNNVGYTLMKMDGKTPPDTQATSSWINLLSYIDSPRSPIVSRLLLIGPFSLLTIMLLYFFWTRSSQVYEFFQVPIKILSSIVMSNYGLYFVILCIFLILGIELHRWHLALKIAKVNFGIERRRLTEVNLHIKSDIAVPSINEDGNRFTIFTLSLENIGDGPVDILAALASSRLLSSKINDGIGTRSRDVEWNDYDASFWNNPNTNAIFAGISTTRTLVSSADEFMRLATREQGHVRRIDRINNKARIDNSSLQMMYQVFTVARGYPLGEILHQLDQENNRRKGASYFHNLAQPNYERWKAVQQALHNINRFVFRMATEESDPLGTLTTPDAWRIFLLHHWDFIDQPSQILTFEEVTEEVRQRFYPNLALPPDFPDDPNFRVAQQFCKSQLHSVLKDWEKMKSTIAACKDFDNSRTGDSENSVFLTPRKNSWPQNGYCLLIHTNPKYKQRWLKLLSEGYLFSHVSEPAPYRHRVDERDIPNDPRILEPFVIRMHYFLKTIHLGEKNTGENATRIVDS